MTFRHFLITLTVASCAMLGTVTKAQNLPLPSPTARDVYVGCYLLVHNKDVARDTAGKSENFSAAMCEFIQATAIVYRGQRVEGKDNRKRFCLPKAAEISTDPARAMAYAYLDAYESLLRDRGAAIADMSGVELFSAALIVKWPCQK